MLYLFVCFFSILPLILANKDYQTRKERLLHPWHKSHEGVNGASVSLYVADVVKPLTDLSARHTAVEREIADRTRVELTRDSQTLDRPDRAGPALRTGSVLPAPEQHASRGLSDDIIVPSASLFVGLQHGVGVIR